MPITSDFDNTVISITGGPVGAAELNAVITARNTAGYWLTDVKWISLNSALALFGKRHTVFGYPQAQKVNQVSGFQAALNADKATETANGFWPTGIFIRPDGVVFIHYQQLDELPT